MVGQEIERERVLKLHLKCSLHNTQTESSNFTFREWNVKVHRCHNLRPMQCYIVENVEIDFCFPSSFHVITSLVHRSTTAWKSANTSAWKWAVSFARTNKLNWKISLGNGVIFEMNANPFLHRCNQGTWPALKLNTCACNVFMLCPQLVWFHFSIVQSFNAKSQMAYASAKSKVKNTSWFICSATLINSLLLKSGFASLSCNAISVITFCWPAIDLIKRWTGGYTIACRCRRSDQLRLPCTALKRATMLPIGENSHN